MGYQPYPHRRKGYRMCSISYQPYPIPVIPGTGKWIADELGKTKSRTTLKVAYNPKYTIAEYGFDTTRKAKWIADELENERYDPIMESWLELQLHIHDFILEAFTNNASSMKSKISSIPSRPILSPTSP